MKKGFTLIELLAVIVILAIIALIATPIVLGIIDNTRESGAIESAKLYVDGLKTRLISSSLGSANSILVPESCIITNGEVSCDGIDYDYEISGEKPKSGTIVFENGIIKSYDICVMNYSVTYDQNTGEPSAKKANCDSGALPSDTIIYNKESVPTDPNLNVLSDSVSECGTEEYPFLIKTPVDFIYFKNQVNSDIGSMRTSSSCSITNSDPKSAYYKQTDSIALNNVKSYYTWSITTSNLYSWEPINGFRGVYDGDHNTIAGIYISNSSSNQAIFGLVKNGAVIKNLNIDKSFISGDYNIGGLIASSDSTNINIDNVNVNAKILSSSSNVGGLIANVYSSESVANGDTVITNSSFAGTIKAGNYVGGLVGYYYKPENIDTKLIVTNSTNKSTISAITDERESIRAGGLISSVYTTDIEISNSKNIGSIVDFDGSAGIIAYYNGNYPGGYTTLKITDSYNTGSISRKLKNNTITSMDTGVAGLVSYVTGGEMTIKNSYNTGAITGASKVAGLVANDFTVTSYINSCYNSGNLKLVSSNNDLDSFTRYIGGLVAYKTSNNPVEKSYNKGSIFVKMNNGSYVNAAGLVGSLEGAGVLFNSYNAGTITIDESNVTDSPYYYIAGLTNSNNYTNFGYNIGDINILSKNSVGNYVSGVRNGQIPMAPATTVYNTGRINISGEQSTYNKIAELFILATPGSSGGYLSGRNPAFIDATVPAAVNATSYSSVNDLPSVLSIVGSSFKQGSDDNHPILTWQ